MEMIIRKIERNIYEQFFKETFYPVHYQSPEWLNCVKHTRQGDDYYGVYDEMNKLFAIFIGTTRKIEVYSKLPFTSQYEFVLRRGPVMDYSEENIMKFTKAAKKFMKQQNVLFFNITPNVAIERTTCKIPTDLNLQNTFQKNGWEETEYLYFDGRIPNYESIVNLDKETLVEIEKTFKKDTMRKVRKAKKMGIEIVKQTNVVMEECYPLFEETGKRDNFTIQPIDFYKELLNEFGENAIFYTAFIHLPFYLEYVEKNQAQKVELIDKIKSDIEKYGEKRMIGVAIVLNSQTMAFYESGATSDDYRETMANYLLHYEAITDSYEKGMKMYNFGSVSGDFNPDNHLYGLYYFKSRFASETVHYIGELELYTNKIEKYLFQKLKKIKTLRK